MHALLFYHLLIQSCYYFKHCYTWARLHHERVTSWQQVIFMTVSTTEQNNIVSRGPVEGCRISPRRRRTTHRTGRLKNDVSRRADEERRISPYTSHVLAVKAPRYDVFRPRGEIRRSSTGRRDTTLFRSAVGIHPVCISSSFHTYIFHTSIEPSFIVVHICYSPRVWC